MPTLKELLVRMAELEQQIEHATAAGREDALSQIQTIMEEHGLTVADLGGRPRGSGGTGQGGPAKGPARKSRGPAAGQKVAPKFKDPDSGATWSGRGLKPKWLTAALADGKKIEDFAV